MASTSKPSYENLRRAREARWSDPAQRQALAERNRARSSKPGSAWRRTKPGRSSMITISPIPAKTVETAHVQTVNFLSELRLNLLSDKELETSLREKVAHLQQLERLPKFFRDAAPDYQQTRADVLSFQNELMKRKLSRLQREQEQAVEHTEELAHV